MDKQIINNRVNHAYSNNLGLINQAENSLSRVYHVLTTNGKFNPIEKIIVYDENGKEYNLGKYFTSEDTPYKNKDLHNIIVDSIARRNKEDKTRKENFIYKDTLYLYNGKGVTINHIMEKVLDFTTDTNENYKSYIILDFQTPCTVKDWKNGEMQEISQVKFFISGTCENVKTNFGKKVAQLEEELKKENIKIDSYNLEKLLKLYDIKKIIKEV